MPKTFQARGDSSSANNASLNVENLNQQPVVSLTFTGSGPTPDESLDFNDGLPDPDTVVSVNGGPSQTFTVEFVGELPNVNQLQNVNGQDLRGETIMVVTLEDGNRLFFLLDQSIDAATIGAINNRAYNILGLRDDCFLAGTRVTTPAGPRPIETLTPGDEIRLATGDIASVLWIGVGAATLKSRMAAPIGIPAGAFGATETLWLSPLHRILVRDTALHALFGVPEALVAACDLPGTLAWPGGPVSYVHLLVEGHQLIEVGGVVAETLYPPRLSACRLGSADPALVETMSTGSDFCRPTLTSREAAVWRRMTGRRAA